MAETKYGKYIVTDLNKVADSLGTRVYCLHGGVFEGAPYVDCAWFWPQPKEVVVVDKSHTHAFGEVVTFFGSNPEDPTDLGGEIEFWLGDEPNIIKKSCVIFVPKGIPHCPLILKRVDRPIFHFATATDKNYRGPHEMEWRFLTVRVDVCQRSEKSVATVKGKLEQLDKATDFTSLLVGKDSAGNDIIQALQFGGK